MANNIKPIFEYDFLNDQRLGPHRAISRDYEEKVLFEKILEDTDRKNLCIGKKGRVLTVSLSDEDKKGARETRVSCASNKGISFKQCLHPAV